MPLEQSPLGEDHCLDRYLHHLAVERGCSRHTIDAYHRDLRRFQTFLTDVRHKALAQVDREDITVFLQALRKRGLSSPTSARGMTPRRPTHERAHLRDRGGLGGELAKRYVTAATTES